MSSASTITSKSFPRQECFSGAALSEGGRKILKISDFLLSFFKCVEIKVINNNIYIYTTSRRGRDRGRRRSRRKWDLISTKWLQL